MRLSFHGAAGGVTGSCHRLELGRRQVLIDCGLFQGGRTPQEENAAPFGFDPAAIDILILTHAHLDHCGRIPLLVRRGFRGEIICTAATRELARLVLLDAASLNEEEARRRGRRHAPLFDTLDVMDSLDRFGRIARLGEPIALGPGVTASLHEAGHILGSASVLIETGAPLPPRRILFSGDIGPRERLLLRPPAPPAGAGIAVMESTYGDRNHRDLDATVAEFEAVLQRAVARGGNVIIPSFALERAQEILFVIGRAIASGRLPAGLQVFLDSPMASAATRIFRRHGAALRPEIGALLERGRDPFTLPGLHVTRDAAQSRALGRLRGGAVIIAGSGMCTGGRVRHHLRRNLARAENAVVFVGFAAQGTLARILIDGAPSVRLSGEEIPVRASLHTIGGFSAHAGRDDLIDWHRRAGAPGRVFLVHGEDAPRRALAGGLEPAEVILPALHEGWDL